MKEKHYRVAIARVYRDVSVQLVTARSKRDARALALEEAKSDVPQRDDLVSSMERRVIECDVEDGYPADGQTP